MTLQLYQKLYAILCGAASDAIDLLSTSDGLLQAKRTLENALLTAEELYLSAPSDTSLLEQHTIVMQENP